MKKFSPKEFDLLIHQIGLQTDWASTRFYNSKEGNDRGRR